MNRINRKATASPPCFDPASLVHCMVWLLLLLIAGGAAARDDAGLLDIIITPNEGVPVIATPGQHFDAIVRVQGALELRQADRVVPLATQWLPQPGDRHMARCTIPAGTEAGAYSIVLRAGDQEDFNGRSVWVVPEFPEVYEIAHLTDTHVGSGRHPRPSEDIFREMIQHVNDSPAAFVVITGDLTDNGTPEQFQQFLEVLNTSTKPTFVCAGNHDRLARNYEAVFGPLTYWFTYGHDAYLAFDTKDFRVADELGVQDALLERYRRAMMPARWRIGLTHRYEADMGLRAQLILFVDYPLDHLLYGHWHRENVSNVQAMPWPKVKATVTPAAINGAMRMVAIGRAVAGEGIEPAPVLRAVKVREEERVAP
jgi:predicted phosphodiesterase